MQPQVALTPDDSGIECKTSQEESEVEGEPRLIRGSSSTASQLSLAGSIASSSNNAARFVVKWLAKLPFVSERSRVRLDASISFFLPAQIVWCGGTRHLEELKDESIVVTGPLMSL